LYTDSSDSDASERPPSQDPYKVTVARWRSRVAARSSLPSLPTHYLSPSDVTPPTLRQILPRTSRITSSTSCSHFASEEESSRGHLASRYPPHHSLSYHFSSDDTSSDSLSDSSLDYSSDSSSGHSLPDSSIDAPATIFAGPSRKRCRSLTVSVPLATLVPGALSPAHADLLPPRKRIRGTDISKITRKPSRTGKHGHEKRKSSKEAKDAKPKVGKVDIDVDTTAAEAATAKEADVGVKVGIRSYGEEEAEEEAESRDRGTIEIGVDMVSDIERARREHEHGMLAASEQRTGVLARIRVLERDNIRLLIDGMKRWLPVFPHHNCPQKYQVKYASCTMQEAVHRLGGTLTKRQLELMLCVCPVVEALMKLINQEGIGFQGINLNIVCDETIVRIPYVNEILTIQGNRSNGGSNSRLNIISCTKTQKYIQKGCHVFLAQVSVKKTEDKSEEKRLEDVLIVQDFLEVFPEDLLGLPPARQVELQIDLVLGAAPVA
ncbi:hypothetical protein Tco_0044592, partial [Tanacetum coccineum]